MNERTTLVVMAAGMGSRYGGLKQIDPVGPNGEIILDFSVYDAAKAGFDKTVFIIRRDIEHDFREITKKRIEKMMDVEYVFQDMDYLPTGFSVPDGRVKPWGTAHAVYCLGDKVDTPFALINADDYYGRQSYQLICDRLKKENAACMVGFHLGNTLTENGTVSRGLCTVEDGLLKSVTEHTALDRNSGFAEDTIASMNMWGLAPDFLGHIEADFITFLNNLENPLKDEFYIPGVIDRMIQTKGLQVKVLPTTEKWYGVTYQEDRATVVQAMGDLVAGGHYDGI